MAINPVSSSFPLADSTGTSSTSAAQTGTQQASTPTTATATGISTDQLAAMEASAVDPLLIGDASQSSADRSAALVDSFTTMLGGGSGSDSASSDPLLEALNGESNGSSSSHASSGSASSVDSVLNDSLTTFLMQQASGQYLNAQAMDGIIQSTSGVQKSTAA